MPQATGAPAALPGTPVPPARAPPTFAGPSDRGRADHRLSSPASRRVRRAPARHHRRPRRRRRRELWRAELRPERRSRRTAMRVLSPPARRSTRSRAPTARCVARAVRHGDRAAARQGRLGDRHRRGKLWRCAPPTAPASGPSIRAASADAAAIAGNTLFVAATDGRVRAHDLRTGDDDLEHRLRRRHPASRWSSATASTSARATGTSTA